MTDYIYRVTGYGAIGGVLIQQLIRCRDCEYYNPESRSCNSHDCPGDIMEPDDFCSWAEPKKGGNHV